MVERLEQQLAKLRPYLEEPNQIRAALQLDQDLPRHKAKMDRWRERTAATVEEVCGPGEAQRFRQVSVLGRMRSGTPVSLFLAYVQAAANYLAELISDLKENEPMAPIENQPRGDGVFVVHGHDRAALAEVARFLESELKLDVTILQEKALGTATLAEKLDRNRNPAFAVVILSPDDLGRSVKEDELRPRARENVILELGYFMGALGREKVCILRVGDVGVPSDLGGVAWHRFDENGGWKAKLRAELEAAGIVE